MQCLIELPDQAIKRRLGTFIHTATIPVPSRGDKHWS